MPIPPNIHITGLKQPDDGAVVVMHCPECGKTDIMWSGYATKPKGGALWVLEMGADCFHPFPPMEFNLWQTVKEIGLYATGWKRL